MSKKGLKQIFPANFYSEIDHAHDFYVGQICFAHTVRPNRVPTFLSPVKQAEVDGGEDLFKLISSQGGVPKSHLPIHKFKLENDEFFYVQRGKIRPVVILARASEKNWIQGKIKGAVYLCTPIYSIRPDQGQDFVVRVQTYQMANLFYLPESPKGIEEEGIVRFEMLQPVHDSCLQRMKNISRNFVCLHEDALKLFLNQYHKFTTGVPIDPSIDEIATLYAQDVLTEFEVIKAQEKMSAVGKAPVTSPIAQEAKPS